MTSSHQASVRYEERPAKAVLPCDGAQLLEGSAAKDHTRPGLEIKRFHATAFSGQRSKTVV